MATMGFSEYPALTWLLSRVILAVAEPIATHEPPTARRSKTLA